MKLKYTEDELAQDEQEFTKSTKVELDELSFDEAKRFTISGFAESEYGPMLFLEGDRFVGYKEGSGTEKRLAREYGLDTDDWIGKQVDIKLHTFKVGPKKTPKDGRLILPVVVGEPFANEDLPF